MLTFRNQADLEDLAILAILEVLATLVEVVILQAMVEGEVLKENE